MTTCSAGKLVIKGNNALFLNVATKSRAITFMAKRLKQYPGTHLRLKSIRLKGKWKNKLAEIAVPEANFKGNPVAKASFTSKRARSMGT
jgi:hypothetical protein